LTSQGWATGRQTAGAVPRPERRAAGGIRQNIDENEHTHERPGAALFKFNGDDRRI